MLLDREAFDPEVSIVCINLKEQANENLEERVKDLVQEGIGLRDIEPVRAKRLESRTEKPGLVKIEFVSKEEKIRVLRGKQELRDTREFGRVYLRSSMSHTDRLIQNNFNQILREILNGYKYRVSGNGKIILKDEHRDDREELLERLDANVGNIDNEVDNEQDGEPRAFLPVGGNRGRWRGRGFRVRGRGRQGYRR